MVWGKNPVFNSRRSAPASLVLHAAGGAGFYGRNRRDTRRRYSTAVFPLYGLPIDTPQGVTARNRDKAEKQENNESRHSYILIRGLFVFCCRRCCSSLAGAVCPRCSGSPMPLGRLVGSALGIDRNLRLGGRVGFDLVDLRLLRALAAEVVFDLFVVRAYIGVELLAFLVGHALDVHPLVLLPASLVLRLDLRAEQGFPDTQAAFFRSAVSRLRLLLPLGFLLVAEGSPAPVCRR